ncbi:glycerate dehydrogenase [Alcanivorax hongdengensis A-11-3]|uniref:Glycerate dehydrogenase n=1 Tax=Alcanivorax hongdengensis A-11-3 TaxID=1177179 RepID=L0WET1_9GAMM|nr:2-hydroxyacid dehydrogenase [Alcanivorax hongdengensis]EKF75526.1 glycerate dehydrogenase [Alcanivorax hongdengensis A-11-3]
MQGVFLDADTVRPDELDLSALNALLPHWQCYRHTTPAQTVERLDGAAVVITNKVVLDADVLARAPDLKLICISATGTNNVDLAVARERGITVCNVSGYAGATVVQHTLALMLSLATRWYEYAADVRAGEWSRSPQFCLLSHPVTELAGKTLGIIGYGNLGRGVARVAEALGMRVVVAQSLQGAAEQRGRLPLTHLLAEADVVSLHCPLTAQTERLVNRSFLAQMKPGALLINTARGGLVDEPALAEALRNGHLGGAGLDVLSVEPPPADHVLLADDLPNLIITPHNAWISRECRQRLLDGVADNIRQWQAGTPVNVVN